MRLRQEAADAATQVYEILGASPSDDQAKAAVDRIERAITEAVLSESRRCAKVAQGCCSADLDMAHKIAKALELEHTALIANLSALR